MLSLDQEQILGFSVQGGVMGQEDAIKKLKQNHPTHPKKIIGAILRNILFQKTSEKKISDLVGLVTHPLIASFCTLYKRPKRP